MRRVVLLTAAVLGVLIPCRGHEAALSDHIQLVSGIARNDNAGAGYYVVAFRDVPDGQKMIGVVFDEPGRVAVLRLEDFVGQRPFNPAVLDGSVYEPELRAAISAWIQQTQTVRATWGAIKADWGDAEP